MVLEEAADGNSTAAGKKLHVVKDIPILDLTETTYTLAQELIHTKAMLKEYPEDALHMAVAALNGIYYILWNFAHINNAETKRKIETSVRYRGYECPVICTPEELMGD